VRESKRIEVRRGSLKNRYGIKTHPLCVCSRAKKEHYNNALKCVFKSSRDKNYSWASPLD
jgi:hypothetical protein